MNRKGVMGRRHSENNAPNRTKLPFRVGKTGGKCAKPTLYLPRTETSRSTCPDEVADIQAAHLCPHFSAYFAQPSFVNRSTIEV